MRKCIGILIVLLMVGVFLGHAEENEKKISLKETIYHALKNNLDLQIQMEDALISWKALTVRKAIFIPTISVEGRKLSTKEPPRGVLSGVGADEISEENLISMDITASQLLPTGGTLSFSLYNYKSESNSIFNSLDPYISSRGTLTLNQPLLKNFGISITKRDIIIAKKDLKISRYQLKQNIIDLVYNVEEAYWNLVYAHQNLDAAKKALQRARDLLRQNEIKVKVGSAAPIEKLSSQAEVARNESQVIQAEQRIQTSEVSLKRILNMSKEDIRLIPIDEPKLKKLEVDFEKFLAEALRNRPDMQRARLELEKYGINVKYAKNQVLPQLDLIASYYTTGQAGTVWDFKKDPLRDPTFVASDRYNPTKYSVWHSMNQVFGLDYKNYDIRLELTIPLSFKREKAELAQAKINQRRGMLTLQNTENTVYSEIKNVIKELESNAKLVEADRIAMELQGENLKAEERRLAVGLSTNFQVLDYQRRYADAKSQALQSIINFNMTLARINKYLARTFETYDIKFADFVKK